MITEHEQLLHNLEYLKLPEMALHLNDTVDFINRNELTFEEGLIRLTNYEIEHKEEAAIKAMVKTGAFPHLKELKEFDFDFQENINKEEIMDFLNHRFLANKENIVFRKFRSRENTSSDLNRDIGSKKKDVNIFHQVS